MSRLEKRRDEFERLAESLRERLDAALESGTDEEIRSYAIAAMDAAIKASEIDGEIFDRRIAEKKRRGAA